MKEGHKAKGNYLADQVRFRVMETDRVPKPVKLGKPVTIFEKARAKMGGNK